MTEAALKVSAEFAKLAEKYRESPFFMKFCDLSEDMKKIENERANKFVRLIISIIFKWKNSLYAEQSLDNCKQYFKGYGK